MVNPEDVPKVTLSNGSKIPAIGLGTFGSDNVNAQDIADAVYKAIKGGWRHLDCASIYSNEKEIGGSIKKAIDEGIVKREDLWITSKVWNDMHAPEDVIQSCKQSIADLQCDYLDLYLVHWPFPNTHPVGCDGDTRDDDSKPFIIDDYMKTWGAMEKLFDMGLVKTIGTSNNTIPKFDLMLIHPDLKIKPVVNEMELHPHFQQPEFREYLKKHDITAIGYSPIGSPARPARDTTPEDTVPTQDPVIVEIAKKFNVHPAIICVKWAVQSGIIPIPFSTNHYMNNLEAIAEMDPLIDEDIKNINSIDKNCRLIKGQVFLWREGLTWEALWDLDGNIPQ